MHWDCEYCETRKLLGKSHRHCPKCGAPQDPARRYFPAEDEKVAVEDHVYQGADRVCESCDTPNAAAAAFCVNCGAPTEGGAEVRRVTADGTSPTPHAAHAVPPAPLALPASPGSSRGCLGLAAGALATLAMVVTSFCWTRAEAFRVSGHAWERRIEVEQFRTVQESGWRDAVPSDARDLSCSSRQRETRQVPDGESCETVNVDDGDGTFHQEQSCATSYRTEPVYDEHCDWRADRWRSEAALVERGEDRQPRWPATGFPGCRDLGCRREASRSAVYTLILSGDDGQIRSCAVEESLWTGAGPGTRLRGRVRVVTGGVACGTLAPE
jgi:hypothetical protein